MNKKGIFGFSLKSYLLGFLVGIIVILGIFFLLSNFQASDITTPRVDHPTSISVIFPVENSEVELSPGEIEIEQEEVETVSLYIGNIESDSVIDVYATVEALAFGGESIDTLLCAFDDTGTDTTNEYSLELGESISRGLIVKDTGSDLGTYVCSVTVKGLPTGDETTSLVVTIE
jgi:hypothetical protein